MGIILNVLITGGAGFVGSHLIERFISKQYNVTVIDNLLTGSKKNVEPFIENDNFINLASEIYLPLIKELKK